MGRSCEAGRRAAAIGSLLAGPAPDPRADVALQDVGNASGEVSLSTHLDGLTPVIDQVA